MLAISEEKLIAKGMPDDQIEMALEMSKKFMSPGFITITGFATNMFFGSIIALITSAFVKKEGNPFDTVIEKENKE